MPRLRLLFLPPLFSAVLASPIASAQTISSPVVEPQRLVGGNALALRPSSLNPYGVSYSDCMLDMTLHFSLVLSGFTAGQTVQVWGSKSSTSDCVALADRGSGASPVCWSVSQSITVEGSGGESSFDVRVQDLVGWQTTPPATQAAALNPPPKGPEACTAQPSFASVPMTITFLTVDSGGNPLGVPYVFSVQTDLVGPPAPRGLCESAGETLLNLSWTPNSDSDTIGYDVYVDPIPALVPEDAGIGVDSGAITLCPGAGADWEGGCFTLQSGSSLSPESGTCADNAVCGDTILTGAIVPDAGTAGDAAVDTGTASTDSGDDASGDDGGSGEVGNGGISTIPGEYLFQASSTKQTILGSSSAQYTLTGLVDYVTYNMTLSAVDGFGNIGPSTTPVCDYPEPVNDFWQTYEQDGGGKGGYCALDSVGVGKTSLGGVALTLGVGALLRRRRRNRKS